MLTRVMSLAEIIPYRLMVLKIWPIVGGMVLGGCRPGVSFG